MRIEDFDYELPPERIAQHPAEHRDASRLLVLQRQDGQVVHRRFADFADYPGPGDVLVLNNSRVIAARLRGRKLPEGGQVEILLSEPVGRNDWWVMLRPGKRVRPGTCLEFQRGGAAITATVREKNREGHCRLEFAGPADVLDRLDELGEVPLPPYIERTAAPSDRDRERYQTVFAQPPGSVAAPTAGLHFTTEFLDRLRVRGVEVRFVTLHVGLGTFAPVKAERVEDHVMHEEYGELPAETATCIGAAKAAGRRVFAVGTTSLRVLESAARAQAGRPLEAWSGHTRLFVHPPAGFAVVDALLTNFHLPRSTLLLLVSAFAAPGRTSGRQRVLAAYAEAVREGYRFFSYGDAMLIL
ncbi:MAG: tRNA preQ1(34) S-adenosylmethionine ribosyltransferase-isomerase QueA [Verrucomicrobiales bacterium]|nr:tRNA preQ1(34) S-adenosylmethionine ribosyltransferase-isomerase QueA [Verrucomicrobiales bacterium]